MDVANIKESDVKSIYPYLPEDRKFGEAGRLAIVGGGYLNYNPPIISAYTASMFPLDSIYLLIPEKLARLKGFSNITISMILLPDFKITNGVVNRILKLINRKKLIADVFHIGPGLSGHKNYVLKLIKELNEREYFLLLDSGSLYPELLDMELDWSKVVLSPHEGEVKQLFNVGDPRKLDDADIKLNILAKLLDGIYFYMDGKPKIKYVFKGSKPLRYGVNYILTGIYSAFLTLTKDIERASLLTLYVYMKTVENINEKYCLHWTLEDFVYTVKDVLIKLCKTG